MMLAAIFKMAISSVMPQVHLNKDCSLGKGFIQLTLSIR